MGTATTLPVIMGEDEKIGRDGLIPVTAAPGGGVMLVLLTPKKAFVGGMTTSVETLLTLRLVKLISVVVIGVAFTLASMMVPSVAIITLNTTCFIDFLECG